MDGIPVTIPARTLVDLAAQASRRELERAVARAKREGLTDRREVEDLASRAPTTARGRVMRMTVAGTGSWRGRDTR